MKVSLRPASLCLLSVVAVMGLNLSPALADAGDGVESKSFNLSVGLDLFTGVNTNLFFEDGDGVQGDTNAAPRVKLIPSLSLTTVSPQDLNLSANADLGFDFYFGDESISSQSSVEWNLGLNMHIKPKAAASFMVLGAVNRTNQPSNKQGEDNYTQNLFRLGGVLGIHPGGRALQGFLGYDFNLYRFDTFANSEIFGGALAATDLNSLNKHKHHVNGKVVYQFLPKTIAAINVDWNVISYDQPTRQLPNNGSNTELLNVDSSPLRITTGINGLIASSLGLRLFVGYGNGFYDGAQDPYNILVDSQLTYYFGLGRKSSVHVGYKRDFYDATLGSFFNSNRITAGYNQKLLNEKLDFTLDAGLDFRDYTLEFSGDNIAANGSGSYAIPDNISDTYINVDANLRYQVTDWLHAGVSYGLLVNSTDSNSDVIAGSRELQGRGFVQHIIMLNAGVRY